MLLISNRWNTISLRWHCKPNLSYSLGYDLNVFFDFSNFKPQHSCKKVIKKNKNKKVHKFTWVFFVQTFGVAVTARNIVQLKMGKNGSALQQRKASVPFPLNKREREISVSCAWLLHVNILKIFEIFPWHLNNAH